MNSEDQSCKTPRWRLLKAQLNNLNPQGFKEKMTALPDTVILDVRTPGEFSFSALPNAINLNYLGNDFIEKLQKLDASKTYLVYCRTGRRSIRVCTLMRNGGFDPSEIFNLDGGLVAWQEAFVN